MKPPRRMLSSSSDSNVIGAMRADLDVYSRTEPAYDTVLGAETLAKKLESLGAAPPSDGGATLAGTSSATQGAALSIVAKTMLMLAGTAIVGVSAFQALNSGDETARGPAPTPAVAPARAPSALPLSPPPAPIEAARPKSAKLTPAQTPRTARPATRESASRREIAQLMRVRALLERDPAAAYRVAQASAREFPTGALREEREGLSIIALFGMGDARARAEAIRFLARYPESPLRDRIEGLAANSR